MRNTFGIMLVAVAALCTAGSAEISAAQDGRTIVTEHFLVSCEGTNIYARQVSELLESAYGRFEQAAGDLGFATHRPDEKLAWICFTRPADFKQYSIVNDKMDLSYMTGYYSSRTNKVAILQGGRRLVAGANILNRPAAEAAFRPVSDSGVNALSGSEYTEITKITHELAHQLSFNFGLQKRGVMYPVWVSEGLAASFEESIYNGGNFSSLNSVRVQTLARMHREGTLIALEELISMTRAPSSQSAEGMEIYAEAWGFFHHLAKSRPAELRRYLTYLGELPIGVRPHHAIVEEFISAFGPATELGSGWQAYLEKLGGPEQPAVIAAASSMEIPD